MKTPDVTPVQKLMTALGALVAAAISVAVAFGVELTAGQITALGGAYTAFASVVVIADAVIRHGRSNVAAAQAAAPVVVVEKKAAPKKK